MQRVIMSACVGLMGWSMLAGASEPFKKETTYSIHSTSTEVTTTAKNSSEYDEILAGFLLPKFKEALEATPYVISIQGLEGEETEETASTYSDYITVKRTSHVFATLKLPARVSLLFEVEETYRKCKVPETTISVSPSGAHPSDRHGASTTVSTSGCDLKSELEIKGPVAVYGSYTSSLNVDRLLKDKQELTISVDKSYDNKDLELETKFSINSMSWESNMLSFMKAFNIQPQVESLNIHPASAGGPTLVLNRQTVLLGISRFIRQVNERILQ